MPWTDKDLARLAVEATTLRTEIRIGGTIGKKRDLTPEELGDRTLHNADCEVIRALTTEEERLRMKLVSRVFTPTELEDKKTDLATKEAELRQAKQAPFSLTTPHSLLTRSLLAHSSLTTPSSLLTHSSHLSLIHI